MWRDKQRLCVALATLMGLTASCSDESLTPVPVGVGGEGGLGGAGGQATELATYPADPDPVAPAACAADVAAHWQPVLPPACAGQRTCVDERQRFWVDGEPFFPRGLYNGGFEHEWLFENCPSGAPCEATNPSDAAGFVAMLTDAGFNIIMDRSRYLAPALLDAIHAAPDMKIAHLLWSDPFTVEGHDSMVADIAAAAADPDVVMWFGPDEIDLWGNWWEATGIRRLLRGASPEIDALLTGPYAPPNAEPYMPADEPAHDPHNLPFGAALAYDPGLAAGSEVYDMLLPITYPFEEAYSSANAGIWGTWRTSHFADQGRPMIPILQMVGIPEMGLSQPTPEQIRGQIASALAHGARGFFYFNLIGHKPKHAGRDGWFAPDLPEAWASYGEQHEHVERLLLVMHSEAEEDSGTHAHLEWRRWTLGDRELVLIANPTPYARVIDLDAIIALAPDRYVRSFADCSPFTEREQEVAPYASLWLEVTP